MIEPDCSATKRIELPHERVHGSGFIDEAHRRGVVKDAGCRSATYTWRKLGCMVNFNPITIHLAPV